MTYKNLSLIRIKEIIIIFLLEIMFEYKCVFIASVLRYSRFAFTTA